jgi:hypothetical protein
MKYENCKGCDYLKFHDGQWLCEDSTLEHPDEPIYVNIEDLPFEKCGDKYCSEDKYPIKPLK